MSGQVLDTKDAKITNYAMALPSRSSESSGKEKYMHMVNMQPDKCNDRFETILLDCR